MIGLFQTVEERLVADAMRSKIKKKKYNGSKLHKKKKNK